MPHRILRAKESEGKGHEGKEDILALTVFGTLTVAHPREVR